MAKAVFVLSICLLGLAAFADESVVQTKYGPVQGEVQPGYRAFLGIPYIEPPVGDLRWAAPRPPASWGPNPLPTTSFKPGCPQNCVLPPLTCPDVQSEDCIYLNIYTPRLVNLTQPQPVMVFLPGGHFEQGSSGCALYDASNVVQASNVLVVTVNYRLGFLGWLAADVANIYGNFGFLDQLMALQFVQQNIANFGGDPSQVTLVGQSAGATSIRAHLISPLSSGLFSKVIIQSDPFSLPMRDLDDASQFGIQFATKLGCKPGATSDVLQCLRNQSVPDILAAQKAVEKDLNLFRPIEMFLPWTPVVDKSLIPYHAFDAFQQGKFLKVPMIIGSVSQDAYLFVFKAINFSLSTLDYEAIIAAIFLAESPSVSVQYPPIPVIGDKRPQLGIIGTDYIFECSSRHIMALARMYQTPAIYHYDWDHALSWDGWGPMYEYCVGKVCHGSELPYLFAPPILQKVANLTNEEKELSASIIKYWTNFARTGDPNSESLLPWPAWTPDKLSSMRFATPNNQIITGIRKSYCDYWDKLGYHYGW